MKKAFDQTVRDIKREVNKKVLKVPTIEQKVLDATSNEPWGPHGSLLADIAQASKNYHEYQMIMTVIWKRTNDTGKNWRHVYKALTVLEYLVAHGSERVIDEIREHAYQISTLSDFQYIDSNGRDQGNNVRKKSQSLVVLINDKERIQEVRQKAAANRDKYRNTSMGGMYQPGSYSSSGDRYGDDRYDGRYGTRDDERNGYPRDREWGNRDDDRYGRYGDSYGRDGDRYGRDYEDRYARDGYRDDDYRGRTRSTDDFQYGSRSRSADRDRDHSYEDDGQYSSRGSGAKADDHSQDGSSAGRRLERKYSEQNIGAPPSYEEAVGAARSPSYTERDGETSLASAPKASSPPATTSPSHGVTATATAPLPASASPPAPAAAPPTASDNYKDTFDEFDPRGPFTANGAAPVSSGAAEVDFLGPLSESFPSNSLALVSVTAEATTSESNSANFNSASAFPAPLSESNVNQPFDDPFGDGPFKAVPSAEALPAQQPVITSGNSFHPTSSQNSDLPQPVSHQKIATEFGGAFGNASYTPSGPHSLQPPAHDSSSQQEFSAHSQDIDILADILPPSGSSLVSDSQTGYSTIPAGRPNSQTGFVQQTNQPAFQSGLASVPSQTVPQTAFQGQTSQPAAFPLQVGQTSLQTIPVQPGQSVPQAGFLAQTSQSMALTFPAQAGQASHMSVTTESVQPAPHGGFQSQMGSSQAHFQAPFGDQITQPNAYFYGGYNPQSVSTGPGTTAMVPQLSVGPGVQQNYVGSAPVTSQTGLQAPKMQPASVGQSSLPSITGSSATPQPSKDKFETKSTVWADTLSRGLVNLNISGPKANPLADIGVDFDAINRREKRMEKPTTTTVTSTATMGKAMGSGSGIGRAGATALRPAPNQMAGSSVSIGMGGGPGPIMGGYGGGQSMGMGLGMGMSRPGNVGMGMNMGMGQAHNMQQQMGIPPGSAMPRGYNPMMGNYGQNPYGGGYQ